MQSFIITIMCNLLLLQLVCRRAEPSRHVIRQPGHLSMGRWRRSEYQQSWGQ